MLKILLAVKKFVMGGVLSVEFFVQLVSIVKRLKFRNFKRVT